MIANPVIPARIRRLINVESGLNDGIATPFVSVALAGAATGGEVAATVPRRRRRTGSGRSSSARPWAASVVCWSTRRAERGWAAEGFAGAAVLGLAVCAYASAVALHGNGFIAAFVGGLAFGTTGGRRGQPLVRSSRKQALWCLCWSGWRSAPSRSHPRWKGLTWQIVLYAVLSLTVIRMAPVALALAGAGLDRATIALVGWFGPRGLASVVFALLALEELGSSAADHAVAVITITVLLSVMAHGATADPLASRYARALSPVRQTGHRRRRDTRHTRTQAHPPEALERRRRGKR